jgi:hypothetical protein
MSFFSPTPCSTSSTTSTSSSSSDNYEEKLEMCLMDNELQAVVKEELSSGWSFVNEGTALKPKASILKQKSNKVRTAKGHTRLN